MISNSRLQFIIESCDKYEEQAVKKIQNQSNFQLIFTDTKVYNLDEIILLRRRDMGNTASAIHVVPRDEENYADRALVFLAIDHLLFNTDETKTYTYEQNEYYKELRPVTGINNIVTYEPYNNIKEVPNYINKLKAVLDPDINPTLLQSLYEQIPTSLLSKDGHIEMRMDGEDTIIDILDVFTNEYE